MPAKTNSETDQKKERFSNEKKMKGWIAKFKDDYWCTLIHGETEKEARKNFWYWNPVNDYYDHSFIEVRVVRCPDLDDKPITHENYLKSVFRYIDIDSCEELSEDEFFNDCRCEICRKKVLL